MNNYKEEACHKCEHPNCFNPEHLYKGDAVTNQRDVLSNKCPKGHDLTIWGARQRIGSTKRYCKWCRSNRSR